MFEAFVQAVEETFSVMIDVTAHPVDVAEAPPADRPRPKDISAVIGFTGGYVGMIVLSFPSQVAAQIVERCTGEVAVTDEETADAVSEFLNMISGAAKRSLKAFGQSVDMSLPTVVIGRDHEVFNASGNPVMRIDFESDLGDFFIQMSLSKVRGQTRLIIADDSKLSRRIMRNAMALIAEEVEIIECTDGPETIRQLEALNYKVDLLVLDFKMPDVSGLDLLRSLRMVSDGRTVPVLIVTSDQKIESQLEALRGDIGDLGIYDLLYKPFNSEQVRRAAKRLIELSEGNETA